MKRALEDLLVVCDLENALLPAGGMIPPVDADVVRLFQNRGGRFTVATDRSPAALQAALDGIALSVPAICSGGAQLYDGRAHKALAAHRLDHAAALRAMQELAEQFPQLGAAVQTEDGLLRLAHSSAQLRRWADEQKTNLLYEQPENMPDSWQKVVFCGEEARVDFLEQYLRSRDFGDEIHVSRTEDTVLTLLPAKATRGAALLALARVCGTDANDVVYIGGCADAVEPMSLAGHTAAVKGAPPRVLLAADTVTKISAAEGAVAEYLYDLVRRYEA